MKMGETMAVKSFDVETECENCTKRIHKKDNWIRIYHKYFCTRKCADEFEKRIYTSR